MVDIGNGLIYDNDIPFSEQEQEIQEAINEIRMDVNPMIDMEQNIRPRRLIYVSPDNKFRVILTYKYKNKVSDANNFTLLDETIKVEGL